MQRFDTWATAARVITGTRKFDRGLGQIPHDQLHWLDVPDRVLTVLFKLAVTVHQCLNGRALPAPEFHQPSSTVYGHK